VLETEKLPAGISDLDTSLTDVDAKSLTHGCEGIEEEIEEKAG